MKQTDTNRNKNASNRMHILKMFIPALGVLWLMLVLSFYYIYHKPFTPDMALSLSKAVVRIIFSLWVVGSAGAIGRLLLGQFGSIGIEHLVLQAAVGFGLLSFLVLVLSSTVGWNWWIGAGTLIVISTALRRYLRNWWSDWRSLKEWFNDARGMDYVIMFLVGAILFTTMLEALAPPYKYDALVYHLSLPRDYLLAHRFTFVQNNIFWGMPQQGEMLYSLGIVLGGGELAVLVGWFTGLLTIFGIVAYSRRNFGLTAGLVSVAGLLSGETIAHMFSWGYVDWLAALDGLGFLISFNNWRNTQDKKHLALAGLFAGLALSTKYTAGVIYGAGLLFMIIHGLIERKDRSIAPKDFFWFSIPMFLVTLPWWTKNVIAVGYPFYPMIFPAGAMDRFRLDFFKIPVWGNLLNSAFLPWFATVQGVEGTAGYNTSIGPVLLGLAPFSVLGWFKNKADQNGRRLISTTAYLGIFTLIIWVVASLFSGYLVQSRLYFAGFSIFALLAGIGYQALQTEKTMSVRWGIVFDALVVTILGFSTIGLIISIGRHNPVGSIVGIVPEGDYLGEVTGWLAPTMGSLQELQEGDKALMLWEPRSYYCLPKCIPDVLLDRWAHDYYMYHDIDSILTLWKNHGYTHLLINQTGLDFLRSNDDRFTKESWDALDLLVNQLELIADYGGVYQLYSLPK